MLWADIGITFVVLGFVVGGIAGIRSLRRASNPEIKGSENVDKIKMIHLRRCHACHKDTDSNVDVFVNGVWYHRLCFFAEINKEKLE